MTPPPLLICSRFGLGIKNIRWFEHRLAVISAITVPSLLGQDDRAFHWAIFVDPDIPAGIKERVEALLEPFNGRAFVTTERHSPAGVLRVAETHDARGRNDFIATGRIDDDDAWRPDTVGRVRRAMDEWLATPDRGVGIGITFPRGIEWVMYDMFDVDEALKGNRVTRTAASRHYDYPFHSMSVFVLAPWASRVTAISSAHSRMADFLRASSFDIKLLQTEEPSWLYARHKQAVTSIQKAGLDEAPYTVDELIRMFSLDGAALRNYLERNEEFEYAIEKRTDARQSALRREYEQVVSQLVEGDLDAAEHTLLSERRDAIVAELDRISTSIVGDIPI